MELVVTDVSPKAMWGKTLIWYHEDMAYKRLLLCHNSMMPEMGSNEATTQHCHGRNRDTHKLMTNLVGNKHGVFP